ncbi:MAG TPA: phosphate--AMP phosphotransferase [Candidatus Sumerlaeota bacterium]|nr:phosphate--AMP phosphotransferase [Candidatus Sumerlaeota bacterium]
MLEKVNLSLKTPREEYARLRETLERQLGELQRRVREAGVPLIIVFEGWDAAGKGTMIGRLTLPLDPRGFSVYSTRPPTEEESLRPFLWRFWIKSPPRGRMAVFDRSWYHRVLMDRVEEGLKGSALEQAFRDIRAFERQIADDGAVIIKFFLHISQKTQKKRFDKLRSNHATAWRVSKDDLRRHRKYETYLAATEQMIAETDCAHAPWTIVEAHDERHAHLKILKTAVEALSRTLTEKSGSSDAGTSPVPHASGGESSAPILDSTDMSLTLDREEYEKRLKKGQKQLRDLEHEIYIRRIPVIIVYEGWDAAGKGGNIRRLLEKLDPRGYDVIPVSAPDALENSHHYLWRFWTQVPKGGHIALFDRSWYGRVLVERVEGFCSPEEWRRAYREIIEMERHLTDFGAVIVKFWLHIDPEEQLRRFHDRGEKPWKSWKITDEDWRNREKWDLYKEAVEEMLLRTSVPSAPWTVVESNCKRHARVRALEEVIKAIQLKIHK